jgi:hypothetical protein
MQSKEFGAQEYVWKAGLKGGLLVVTGHGWNTNYVKLDMVQH